MTRLFVPDTRILAKSAVAVSHTGDTNETILATIIIPANALGPNGFIRVRAYWSMTNSANNKTMRHRFNGIAGTLFNLATLTTSATLQQLGMAANRNAANSQILTPSTGTFGASSATVPTAAVDTTAAVDYVLTAQLANSGETITLEAYIAELSYGA
jgi:hypothetical protein